MGDHCPCGDTIGPFEEDIEGELLCPMCCIESAIPCAICSNVGGHVRLYTDDGKRMGPGIGTPEYTAVCEFCEEVS